MYQFDNLQPVFSIRNLTTTYIKNSLNTCSLKNISFNAYPGQVLGIIGESGAGKSSLMRAILQTFQSTKYFKIEGSLTPQIQSSSIGIIMQNPATALCPVLSVYEHFYDALFQHDKKSRKAITIQWLNRVQLLSPEQYLSRYPHQLSGGEQQRICIALALIKHPSILLADEPTASLDPLNCLEILNLLKAFQKEFQLTIVYVSHDLNVIRYIAQHIIVLHNGEILESNSTHNIFHNPKHSYTQNLLRFFNELSYA